FVADEIQTGFGRTGKLFAIEEHFGVVPDLMTISKSLAAGLPLSAVVGKKEMMNEAAPGQLGGTFAGNPVACAAALSVIEVMEEENLNDCSEQLGAKIEDKLTQLAEKNEFVGEIRRLGAMSAVEFVEDAKNRTLDSTRKDSIAIYDTVNGVTSLYARDNN